MAIGCDGVTGSPVRLARADLPDYSQVAVGLLRKLRQIIRSLREKYSGFPLLLCLIFMHIHHSFFSTPLCRPVTVEQTETPAV